jgi:hypothetical protein
MLTHEIGDLHAEQEASQLTVADIRKRDVWGRGLEEGFQARQEGVLACVGVGESGDVLTEVAVALGDEGCRGGKMGGLKWEDRIGHEIVPSGAIVAKSSRPEDIK